MCQHLSETSTGFIPRTNNLCSGKSLQLDFLPLKLKYESSVRLVLDFFHCNARGRIFNPIHKVNLCMLLEPLLMYYRIKEWINGCSCVYMCNIIKLNLGPSIIGVLYVTSYISHYNYVNKYITIKWCLLKIEMSIAMRSVQKVSSYIKWKIETLIEEHTRYKKHCT